MQLRETVCGHHAVDLFVVLHLDVIAHDELQDRAADFELVAMAQTHVPFEGIVVDVGPVRRSEVPNEKLGAFETNLAVVAGHAFLVDVHLALW